MIKVIDLPYTKDALEPIISAETMFYHYEKHHKGYANKLNELIKKNPRLQKKSLVELILSEKGPVYNNAAQVWIHNFFWLSLTPNSVMSQELKQLLKENFGSLEEFMKQFVEAGVNQFGSGWCWLVYDNGLKIVATKDADIPFGYPLLVVDLWEHAYYLDYKNERKKFLENVFDIINWDFVEENIRQIK